MVHMENSLLRDGHYLGTVCQGYWHAEVGKDRWRGWVHRDGLVIWYVIFQIFLLDLPVVIAITTNVRWPSFINLNFISNNYIGLFVVVKQIETFWWLIFPDVFITNRLWSTNKQKSCWVGTETTCYPHRKFDKVMSWNKPCLTSLFSYFRNGYCYSAIVQSKYDSKYDLCCQCWNKKCIFDLVFFLHIFLDSFSVASRADGLKQEDKDVELLALCAQAFKFSNLERTTYRRKLVVEIFTTTGFLEIGYVMSIIKRLVPVWAVDHDEKSISIFLRCPLCISWLKDAKVQFTCCIWTM